MSEGRNSSTGFEWLKKRSSGEEEGANEAPVEEAPNTTGTEKKAPSNSKTTSKRPRKDSPRDAQDAPQRSQRAARRTKTGKRNDPDYELMGVYVRKETRRLMEQALAARGASEEKVQNSELVESLLVEWLQKRGFSPSSTGK